MAIAFPAEIRRIDAWNPWHPKDAIPDPDNTGGGKP
jgi:hypothetical protein